MASFNVSILFETPPAILLKLFSIELEQAVRGEIFLPISVNQTLFSNVLIVGQAAVSCLDYSNY